MSGALTRRAALQLGVYGGVAALLAACGTAPQPATAPLPAATATAPNAVKPAATSVTSVQPVPPTLSAPTPASVSAAKPSLQPKMGGTFRIGMVGDISMLDGHIGTPAATDTVWHMYD